MEGSPGPLGAYRGTTQGPSPLHSDYYTSNNGAGPSAGPVRTPGRSAPARSARAAQTKGFKLQLQAPAPHARGRAHTSWLHQRASYTCLQAVQWRARLAPHALSCTGRGSAKTSFLRNSEPRSDLTLFLKYPGISKARAAGGHARALTAPRRRRRPACNAADTGLLPLALPLIVYFYFLLSLDQIRSLVRERASAAGCGTLCRPASAHGA